MNVILLMLLGALLLVVAVVVFCKVCDYIIDKEINGR